MSEKIRINLGSGHWKLEGWFNVDVDFHTRPDVCSDLSRGLPFDDGVADLLHSEDFLDQLDLRGAKRFLLECRRILKPGGVMRVLVPDLAQLARLYLADPEGLKGLWAEHVGIALETGTAGEVFNLGMRFAGHRFMYDGETLEALLSTCGFKARRRAFNESGIPDLRGLDLRGPHNSLSMHYDCIRPD